jgi:hypothetical protein
MTTLLDSYTRTTKAQAMVKMQLIQEECMLASIQIL